MSICATVTFTLDGTGDRFDHVYEAVCDAVRDIALDIGTYVNGTTGVIEFMVDDYVVFKKKVEMSSAKIGVRLISLDYLLSEKEPIQSPQHNAGSRPSSDGSSAPATPSTLAPRG